MSAQQKPVVLSQLSGHSMAELRNIVAAPVPQCAVNAAVARRLGKEGLVEVVPLPSPYPVHHGAKIDHLCATEAGRQRAREVS